jgi:DNA-binding transcriptional LysR family regulator
VSNVPPINIPTELLRTLIAVVDLRSFTKAAQAMGVTQPAVSAQIKRLQALLAIELFDKSAPGVTVTEAGELVVNYARRMLMINDQIVQLGAPRTEHPPLRIGIPALYGASRLPKALATFRRHAPDVRFNVRGDASENLLRDLRQGQLDLAVALTLTGPAVDARHHWSEEVVWVKGRDATIDTGGPVPLSLITIHESGLLHRLAVSTLQHAGRESDIVFSASGTIGLVAAVSAGLGVTLLPRCEIPGELIAWEDAPLPKPLDVFCGIYLREGADCDLLEVLADTIADILIPHRKAGSGAARDAGTSPPTVRAIAATGGSS